MQDAKTGGSRWVPDIREDEITEFQEQNGDETATYKAVNVHPIISRVLDKLAFFRTHVSAVWYNKLANKTVKDKLDEIDTSISSLNSNLGSWNRVINMSVSSNNTYDVDLPENKAFLAAIENSYGVGALYFIQTSSPSHALNVTVYPLAETASYFKIEPISGQATKVKVTPGTADGTLLVYSF